MPIRPLLVALVCLAALPAAAQSLSEDTIAAPTTPEVAAARQLYIDGDHAAALLVLEPAAEAGDPVAQNIMGDAYWDGTGRERDFARMLIWFERAADQDFGRALHNLGLFWREDRESYPADIDKALGYFQRAVGTGYTLSLSEIGYTLERFAEPPQYAEARAYYQRGADAGHGHAMTNLGSMYHKGLGGPQDFAKARAYYEAALERDIRGGAAGLSFLYSRGQGVPVDWDKALSYVDEFVRLHKADGRAGTYAFVGRDLWDYPEHPADKELALRALERGAALGEGESMRWLGAHYEDGTGRPQDLARARDLYRQAAAAGDAEGWFYLGLSHSEAEPPDNTAAVAAYLAGADAGCAPCLTNLGYHAFMGLGRAQSYDDGLAYTMRAIEAGDDGHVVLTNAGEYNFRGLGTPRDDAAALEYFQASYDKGSISAIWFLGEMYRTGRGTGRDLDRAVALFTEGVQWADPRSVWALGRAYETGEGAVQNVSAAHALYLRAMDLGNWEAAAALARIAAEGPDGTWRDDAAAYRYCVKSVALEEWPFVERGPDDCADYEAALAPDAAAAIRADEP